MAVEEEESSKVCGLCSKLVDHGETLSDDMLEYLIAFLNIQGKYLPTKVCEECHKSSEMCKVFMDKCRNNISKLKNNKLSTTMILGRSRQDIRIMKEKFKDRYLNDEDLPLSARSRNSKYSPVVNVGRDRGHGEQFTGKVSSRGRAVKTKFKPDSLFSENPTIDDNYVNRQRAIKTKKIDPDLKKKQEEDDEEIFPSVGPYQCEICQKISETKRLFVDHIRSEHKDVIDSNVLRSLEADLRKRKKKGLDKPKKKASPKKKKKRAAPKKKKVNPDDSDEDGDDDDEYVPGGKRRKRGSTDGLEGADSNSKGINCEICGTRLSRAKELTRHQQTQTCKRIAAEMEQKGAKTEVENGDNIKSEAKDGEEGSESKGAAEIKKENAENTEEGEPKENGEGGEAKENGEGEGSKENGEHEEEGAKEGGEGAKEEGGEGAKEGGVDGNDTEANTAASDQLENSNDLEQDSAAMKEKSFDPKFKANIAKRYEAEIGTDESRAPLTSAGSEEEAVDPTAQPGGVDERIAEEQRLADNTRVPSPHAQERLPSGFESLMTTGADAYMETQSQSVPSTQQGQQHNFKPWAIKDSSSKESTIDFSSIEPNHLSTETVEDIESQMAALHGNGIGNRTSPWDI